MQCFQKDPNLRVSARKLLKHPWIVNARRSDSVVPAHAPKYDEAVKSVQQWNEALRSPNSDSIRRVSRSRSSIPVPASRGGPLTQNMPTGGNSVVTSRPRTTVETFQPTRTKGNHPSPSMWSSD